MADYPTLALIDRARTDGSLPFALAPNAGELELLARTIADATWSEHVWLTGCIAQEALDFVCRRLEECRRSPIEEGGVTLSAGTLITVE